MIVSSGYKAIMLTSMNMLKHICEKQESEDTESNYERFRRPSAVSTIYCTAELEYLKKEETRTRHLGLACF